MVASSRTSGTSFSTIMRARPSAIAVLPTPASPTYSGLFLRRRHRISMVRSTSTLRPMRGSILPLRAASLRFVADFASALRIAGDAALLAIAPFLAARLREAMGDEIDHIETRHVLHAEQIGGMRLFLAEDRDQH